MKKFNILLTLMIIILITGCTSKNMEVNILNWSSYIPDEVIRDFENETGIKVNYSTYSSNEELLAKVSNVKEGTYDLIFPSDYMVEVMINKNLLSKIDKSMLKNIDNINPLYLNLYYDLNNTYSLPFISASVLISKNNSCINDNIKSYNDLLNPKYKDNIVLIDDQRIIIGMALLSLGYDVNTTNINELDEALEWLEKLKPNIKAYDSDSPKSFLITDEACIGVIWNAESALANFYNNNIVSIYPEEGNFISIDNFAIMKGSQNKINAYKFIDYILNPDIMKKIIESYPYKSVNKKTDEILSNEFLNNKAINIPEEVIKNSHFIKNVGSNIKLYDKVWIKIK